MGSGSYIDDTVLIDADVNSGWTSAADATKEVRRYYLHNWRHDVVALLTGAGKLIQHVTYLSYGSAFGLPAGDTTFKGSYTSADETAMTGYGGPYKLEYDTDLDGVNDADDVTHANSITGGYYDLALDKLNTEQVFNRRGTRGTSTRGSSMGRSTMCGTGCWTATWEDGTGGIRWGMWMGWGCMSMSAVRHLKQWIRSAMWRAQAWGSATIHGPISFMNVQRHA